MKKFFTIAAIATLLASCGGDVRINGHFAGAHEDSVYLMLITPTTMEPVDTTLSDDNGRFTFRISLPERLPTLYYVTCRDQSIPLLVEHGERVEVSSIVGIAQNYTVSGSEGSQKILELNMLLSSGVFSLDSLNKLYTLAQIDTMRSRLAREYAQEYYRVKRSHIRFIMENCGSIAAIYALYQRLPNDDALLDGANDRIYYQLVADSVGRNYPESPYVKALRHDVEKSSAEAAASEALRDRIKELNYPELTLPDMYGRQVELSSLAGKTILLLFWSTAVADVGLLNAELKELYADYGGERFEIYAVSADTEKALWVNTVQMQKLPWINVCDLRGNASPALRTYNVQRLPANYLIDAQGNIVGKNLFGSALEARVKELVK
ncbi:MAG: AhpC/TSA family protein [Rikenellaceae bacterium]|jgi:peroxiredoxin|nr:AhpC/TSA family protein [Rikenellaceae bacterium]